MQTLLVWSGSDCHPCPSVRSTLLDSVRAHIVCMTRHTVVQSVECESRLDPRSYMLIYTQNLCIWLPSLLSVNLFPSAHHQYYLSTVLLSLVYLKCHAFDRVLTVIYFNYLTNAIQENTFTRIKTYVLIHKKPFLSGDCLAHIGLVVHSKLWVSSRVRSNWINCFPFSR